MQVSYTSLSEPRFVKVGVPQGSVIGPLLFLIFYNDITDVIHSASIIKYADDTVIYVADKNVKDIKVVKHDEQCFWTFTPVIKVAILLGWIFHKSIV